MGLGKFVHNGNRWLIIVFMMYLAIVVIFSWVYFLAYQRNPYNFAFNADILRRQNEVVKLATESKVQELEVQLAALKQLVDKLRSSMEPVNVDRDRVIFQTEDYKFIFRIVSDPMPPSPPLFVLVTEIYDNKGNEIVTISRMLSTTFRLPDQPEYSQATVSNLIKDVQSSLDENLLRLSTLSGPAPDVWSYWDFLYISVMSQGTGAYGDILPNSTLIRMLVSLQVVVGLFLLVVVIALVFQRATKQNDHI